MNEVKLSEKGLEAFHSAIVESRKVVDTMGAVQQAFRRMADSVAEYSALMELEKAQELDRRIRQCTEQVEAVSRQVHSAIDGMKAIAASTRASFDIEELCKKSAGEWDELHGRIDQACDALRVAGAKADSLGQKASISLEFIECAGAEFDKISGIIGKLQGDVQDEIRSMKQEMVEARLDAQEMKRLYSDMVEEIKAARQLITEFTRQKEELAVQKELESDALSVQLQKYQAVFDAQQKADMAIRERREADGKILQEMIDYYGLMAQEQKELSLHIQALLTEAKGIHQETRDIMKLAESIRIPDETVMIRVYEGFRNWREKNPNRRSTFYQRLKDLF